MTKAARDRSTDAVFRRARRHFSAFWVGVVMMWAATIGLAVATVVMWGSIAGWVSASFVVLLAPFAVGLLAGAVWDGRLWSVVAAGKTAIETRTGRGLGISNRQGRQVVAYDDVAQRGTTSRPFLHLTLPPADHGTPEIRGAVSVEIFHRVGRQGTIGGPVRICSSDGQHEWWAGNADESRNRVPKAVENQTPVA